MGYLGDKSGFDGIPVGKIRSTCSHVPAERWCSCFGHKWRGAEGKEFCITCFIDKKDADGKEKQAG
jgi:hypothetical protein